jgi:hypothetical protein
MVAILQDHIKVAPAVAICLLAKTEEHIVIQDEVAAVIITVF